MQNVGRPANIAQDSAFGIPGGTVKTFYDYKSNYFTYKCTGPYWTANPLLVAQSTLNYDERQ